MRHQMQFLLAATVVTFTSSCKPANTDNMPHVIQYSTVCKEDGKYMGWPANNGLWVWDDGEILIGFTRGSFVINQGGHNIGAPSDTWLARSLDGGITWEPFKLELTVDGSLATLSEPLNFEDKNFAMRVDGNRFIYSYDRGRSWKGSFEMKGLAEAEELQGYGFTSRTEYLVEDRRTAFLFLSASRETDQAFMARTTDGGLSFEFVSWIAEDTDPSKGRDPYKRAVMPSVVRLSSGDILAALRRREYPQKYVRTIKTRDPWIEVYASNDNGETWEYISRPVLTAETGNGNPPSMIQLSDGRICLAYGYRGFPPKEEEPPFRVKELAPDGSAIGYTPGIKVRFSSNEGKTWGPELVLRNNGYRDIGYPQMLQRKDGNIVTIYYWTRKDSVENYIEAAIWDPGMNWDKPIDIGLH